jgi:predicted Fe-S protein YdhL (DUF1289 family)
MQSQLLLFRGKLLEAKLDVVWGQLDDQVRKRVLRLLAALMARRAADETAPVQESASREVADD